MTTLGKFFYASVPVTEQHDLVPAGEVTAGLAEGNGGLLPEMT